MYTVAHDASQLLDELRRAVLTPELVASDGTTVFVTVADDAVIADYDAVVAAHIPMARYDPTTQLARIAAVREAVRLRADYERVTLLWHAVGTAMGGGDVADAIVTASVFLVEVLKRRDRAAGLN